MDHDFGTTPRKAAEQNNTHRNGVEDEEQNQQQQHEHGDDDELEQNQTNEQQASGGSERRVISVFIDEDEDEDEQELLNTSNQSQELAANGDHNYLLGKDHPKPPSLQEFPVIEGLQIDKDDYSPSRGPSPWKMTSSSAQQQQMAHGRQVQARKRQSGGYYEDYANVHPYYHQQMRGGAGMAPKYVSVMQHQQQMVQQPHYQARLSPLSTMRQSPGMQLGKGLPLSLRPAASGRARMAQQTSIMANLDSPYSHHTSHSMPPPMVHQQQQQHMREELGQQQEDEQLAAGFDDDASAAAPAPMVTAQRGRPIGTRTRAMQRAEGGGGGVEAVQVQQRRSAGYGRSMPTIPVDYAPPPSDDLQHNYAAAPHQQQQRRTGATTTTTGKRQGTSASAKQLQQLRLEQLKQQQLQRQQRAELEEQQKKYLEEEEQMNEEFFERQHSRLKGEIAAATARTSGRRQSQRTPRKTTVQHQQQMMMAQGDEAFLTADGQRKMYTMHDDDEGEEEGSMFINEEFFQEQYSRLSDEIAAATTVKASATRTTRTASSSAHRQQRTPRKSQTASASSAPADPAHKPPMDQLDSSKPPDDPFLPPQQMQLPIRSRTTDSPRHHSLIYDASNTLDGTINAVIRGEASVMQQQFGPPHAGAVHPYQQGMQQMNIHRQMMLQQQQFRAGGGVQQQQGQGGRRTAAFASSPGGNHRRLEELAELAHANASLMEQTTSSMARAYQHQQFQPGQQQRSAQPQQEPTLHFKVVQTNEPFQPTSYQPAQQQVFTVQQQRTEQYAQHISGSVMQKHQQQQEGEDQQQAPLLKPKRARRLSPKKSSAAGFSPGFDEQQQQQSGVGLQQQQVQGGSSSGYTEPPVLRKQQQQQLGTFEQFSSSANSASASTLLGKRRSVQQQHELGSSPAAMDEGKTPKREASKRIGKPKKEGGKDYVTRCICGMTHNDPFMIQCDKCDVWQHGLCMGINESRVPEEYMCEQCEPRKTKNTPMRAAALQRQVLEEAERNKRKSVPAALKMPLSGRGQSMKKMTISKTPSTSTARRFSTKSFSSSTGGEPVDDFEQVTDNSYSRGVRALVAQAPPFVLGEIGLLKRLEKVAHARPLFVSSQQKGLVATQGKTTLPTGMPIVEYTGAVALLAEVRARAPRKPVNHQFSVIYRGLEEDIFVDASKKGSNARFVRRSCRPNATFQHAIVDGKFRLYLYATTIIENSTEITVPFEFDYRNEALGPVECACGQGNPAAYGVMGGPSEHFCPVAEFNKQFQVGSSTANAAAATPQQQQAVHGIGSSMASSPSRTASATKSPKAQAVKEEPKSPGKSSPGHAEHEAGDEGGRRLRARNAVQKLQSSSPSPQVQRGRATRSSLAASSSTTCTAPTSGVAGVQVQAVQPVEGEQGKQQGSSAQKSRPDQSTKPASSSYADFIDPPQQMPSTSANANRQKKPSASTMSASPPPRKRGRPSTVAVVKSEEEEIVPETPPEVMSQSREERKMQQTIAAYERAEQARLKRLQSAEEQQQHPKPAALSPVKKTEAAHVQHQPKQKQQQQAMVASSSTATPKATTTASKKKPGQRQNIPEANLWTELDEVLKRKLAEGEEFVEEFSLPKDYDTLRLKLEKKQKTTTPKVPPIAGTSQQSGGKVPPKKQKKGGNDKFDEFGPSMASRVSIRVAKQQQQAGHGGEAALAALAADEAVPVQQRGGMGGGGVGAVQLGKRGAGKEGKAGKLAEKAIAEPKPEKEAEQFTPAISSPAEETAPEQAGESSSTSSRQMPNTKAHKRLTIDEYRRKKKAEMEAKQQQQQFGGTTSGMEWAAQQPAGTGKTAPTTSSSTSPATTPATRQSPRKSFIPSIATLPSPPQQLEDFAPSPPELGSSAGSAGGAGRHQQLYATPSLEELKKRILTPGGSGPSGSGRQAGESSAGLSSALLDSVPPPPQQQKPEAERGTLDERLKRFVTKRGSKND